MKKKTIIEIEFHEFEKIVKDAYSKDYDFVADQEASNDTCLSYNAKKEKFDAYDKDALNKFIKTGKSYNIAHILFSDLCNKDVLEEGEYIVDISW